MERLTRSNPETNLQTLMNYAYASDRRVKLSYAGSEYGADLCEYISSQAHEYGCLSAPTPDDVMDGMCMECDCNLGILTIVAIQAAELRARLMMIEDILGDEYNLDRLRELMAQNKADIPDMDFGKWIPVTERLPEEGDRCLCNVRSFAFPGSFYQAILRYSKDGFRDGCIYEDGVTHWMPLPEPPKEKT